MKCLNESQVENLLLSVASEKPVLHNRRAELRQFKERKWMVMREIISKRGEGGSKLAERYKKERSEGSLGGRSFTPSYQKKNMSTRFVLNLFWVPCNIIHFSFLYKSSFQFKNPNIYCGLAFFWKLVKGPSIVLAHVLDALTSGLLWFVDLSNIPPNFVSFSVSGTVDVWIRTYSLYTSRSS